jgi:predicted Zn-ribbon and HTH transcriptional regulator
MNDFKRRLIVDLTSEGLSVEKIAKVTKETTAEVAAVLELKRRMQVAQEEARKRRQKNSAHERAMCKSTGYAKEQPIQRGNRVPAWLAAKLRATHSPDNRDLTARLMGDPLPHQQRWKH